MHLRYIFLSSGAECKRRWRNLRTVYVRKRAEALMGTGSKKKYYLNRYMQFLVPYLKATTKTTRFKFVDTNEQPSTSLQVHSPKNQPAENFLENESENEVQPANVREESEDDHEVDVQDLRHTKRLAVSRPRFHRGYVRYVQTKTQKVSADSENPRRQFLMSLLPEINELKEYAFKAFKRRVLALLDELEMPCATTSTTSYSNWNSEPSYGEDVNPKLENN